MKLTQLATGLLLAGLMTGSALAADKIVIAHRGASGYLPEHTLPAKAMAYAQGADYLEQDLVMTKDDQLVVLHDHYLDRVTDVAVGNRKGRSARTAESTFLLHQPELPDRSVAQMDSIPPILCRMGAGNTAFQPAGER